MNRRIQNYCFLSILCILLPIYAHASDKNTVVATMDVGVNPDAMAITQMAVMLML